MFFFKFSSHFTLLLWDQEHNYTRNIYMNKCLSFNASFWRYEIFQVTWVNYVDFCHNRENKETHLTTNVQRSNLRLSDQDDIKYLNLLHSNSKPDLRFARFKFNSTYHVILFIYPSIFFFSTTSNKH